MHTVYVYKCIQDSDCMLKYGMLRQVDNLHHAINHTNDFESCDAHVTW